ncbi:MAG: D-alanyl-D-alanine carboxypeptidase [Bacilli bacterium]|nr:D-alanyl-D-alanine carboxypeptidase [Bacilli bacterium]
MKRSIIVFAIVLISFITFNVKALELDINSKNAILYNLDNNEILYEKDDETKIQIASLTKIMTALVTLDKVDDLDKQIIITSEDLKGLSEANLVTAGFTVGEVVTYRDLLYGLLLPSGADAANALARSVAGSNEEFVNLMNEKAKELKLKNTNFSNPIGLDDENNYSTAKELSIIFNKAIKNETFKTIITSKEYQTSDGKLTLKSTIQKNASRYGIEVPYILGGKTGTTDGAGLCLATIATSNDVNYLLVTTGATYDKIRPHNIDDAKIIYDYFIQNYGNHKIVDKEKSYKSLKTKYLEQDEIKLYPNEDIIKYVPNEYNEKDIKYKYDGVEEVNIFTKKKLGKLKIYYKDELLKEEDVLLKIKCHFSLSKFIKENILYISLGFIAIILIIIFVTKKRKKSLR